MRIPRPRVCTGYTVNLNHLCLTRNVCTVAARRAAHLLIRRREMEMHTSSVIPLGERDGREGGGGGGGELMR